MKKLMKLIVVLAITMGIFKMVDEKNYMRTKPLIKSLKIYNEKGTDTYYLIYKFDKYMNNLEGVTIYLHGRPIKSEVNLLPKQRQKHAFDNWDFNLNKLEDNTFVRTINSRAKHFTVLSFGIYRLSDGTVLPVENRGVTSIKNIDLTRAGVVEKLDLNNLKGTELAYSKRDLMTFGYYKKLERNPVNIGLICTVLLAMSICIVNYVTKVYREEYSSKRDIPKVLTFIIVGIYPIFIFLKMGAVSTIVDILWILLVIRLLLGERIEKKNIRIYMVLTLMLVWWYYSTKTGIAVETGIRMYEGKMVKYFSLPILFSLVYIDRNKLKKISVIYLLSSIPYIIYFKDKLGLNRFGTAVLSGQSLAQILAFVILVSLVFLIHGKIKKRYKLALTGVALSVIPFVLVSGVRGVWVGLFPLMLLIIVSKYRKSSLILLLLVGTLYFYNFTDKNNYLVNRVKSITNIEDDTSNRQRVSMWEFALGEVVKNPLKGIGLGGYKKRATANQELIGKRDILKIKLKDENEKGNKLKLKRDLSDVNFLLKGPDHSHNSYLETLVSTGIPGFLLFSILIILIFIRLIKKYIKLKDQNERLVFISFALIFICDGIYNMTDYGFIMEKPQQSLWFTIAILLNYKGKTIESKNQIKEEGII